MVWDLRAKGWGDILVAIAEAHESIAYLATGMTNDSDKAQQQHAAGQGQHDRQDSAAGCFHCSTDLHVRRGRVIRPSFAHAQPRIHMAEGGGEGLGHVRVGPGLHYGNLS